MAMGELGRAVILLQLLVLFMGADDVAGQLARVQFSEESFTVEEGQQLSITFELLDSNGNVLTTPTTSDIQATVSTDVTLGPAGSIGAADAADISMTSVQVTIPMGTVGTFTTTIDVVANDEDREGSERFRLLSSVTTPASFASTIIVILDDDDNPRIEFQQLQYSVQESEVVYVCAVLRNILEPTTADISSSFVFNFNAPNLASANDISSTSQAFTFPANSVNGTTRCINITAMDDDLLEGDEMFSISFSALVTTLTGVRADGVATVMIQDGDSVTFSFNNPGSTISEGQNATASISTALNLSGSPVLGPGITLERPLMIEFDISPAVDPGDFSVVSSTLTLNAGENVAGITRTFTFAQTVDDLVIENNFTLTISFSSSNFPASNVVLNTATQEMVFVLDNDLSALNILAVNSEVSVTEGEMVEIPFSVSQPNGGSFEIEVTFAVMVTLLSAMSSDFSGLNSTFSIAIGENIPFQTSLTLMAEDDTNFEMNQTLQISVGNFPLSQVDVTILDGDVGPTEVRFLNSSSLMEDENGDNVTLCLELVGITGVEAPVTVNFMISGTAVSGSDFRPLPPSATFMNSPVTCFDVDLLDDERLEGPETLTITISSVDPTGSLTISSTDATVELTIVDNDRFTLDISAPGSVTEGENLAVMVTLGLPSQGSAIEVNATINFSEDTDGSTSDLSPTDVEVSFPPSPPPSNTMSVSVSIMTDNLVEGSETVTVSVSSVSLNQQMGTTQPLNVSIQDIDNVSFQFNATQVNITEGGPNVPICVESTGDATDTLAVAIMVTLTLDSNTDVGFLPSDSLTTTLTFSAGASVNGIECATLSADDDELLEQFIESFTVTISSVTLGMISGITTSTVNIQDDEQATLTFLANSTAIEATEGDTVFVCAQVNVARSSAAGIASDFPVSLILNPLPSWPDTSSDFTIVTNTLPVPASMEVCFEVMLTDDSDLETTEVVMLNLQSVPSENRIAFSPPTSTVTILDDEFVQISLIANETVFEEINSMEAITINITATATVSTGGIIATDFTVALSISDSTATNSGSNADFSFSPTTLEFSSTVSEITITVTLMNDDLLEPTEFIVIEVVDATSPFNITGAEDGRSVNITIFDVTEQMNFNPMIQAVDSMGTTFEEGSILSLRLEAGSIDIQGDGIIQFNFMFENGTAGLDEDFTPLETSVSFTNPAGGPTRRRRIAVMMIQSTIVNITIETDGCLEFSETFNVSVDPSVLDFYPNMTLPSTSTFTIMDMDVANALVSVGVPMSSTVPENYPSLEVCVEVTGVQTIQANFNATIITSNITATSPEDFMLESATFIFPGPSSDPLRRCQPSIAIVNDSNLEGPEDFQVSVMGVSTPDGDVLSTSMNSVNYTIIDPEDVSVAFEMDMIKMDEGSMFNVNIVVITQGSILVDFSVTASLMDGTGALAAMSGLDFVDGTLTFSVPSGTTSGTTIPSNENVNLVDNDLLQPDVIFTITLESSSLYIIGTPAETSVTICDDDEGSLDVELFFIPDNVPNDAFAPAEGISVCGNITNSTGQFGDGPFGVMLIPQFDNETSTVPSVNGSDITFQSLILEFSDLNSTACVRLDLVADMKIEGTERLVVETATNSTNVIGLTVNGMSAMLDIPDRELDPVDGVTVQLQGSQLTVQEGLDFNSQFIQVCAALEPNTAIICTPFTVNVALTEADVASPAADLGVDFDLSIVPPESCPLSPFNTPPFAPSSDPMSFSSSNNLSITFPVGTTNMFCSAISILADTALEGMENFRLQVNSTSIGLIVNTSPFTVSIIDPEDATVSVNESVFTVSEGQNTMVCVVLQPAGQILTSVTVMLKSDSPEVNVLSGLVTLDANVTSGCFSVMAVEDNTVEGDEMVPLTLSVINNTATLNGSQVLITIQDVLTTQDITAGFNFTMLQAAEGTTVMVCADIMSSMTFNVSITFSVANTEPSEISMINPISFAEPNSTACTAVMILQDTDLEGPVGITLVLLNPNPTIMGFTPQTATLTALDINQAQLIFEPLTFQEMEGASFSVCLRLGGEGWFDLERDFEAILESDGVGSGDITIAGRIMFTDGLMVNVIRCQTISVMQDNLLEASENFNIFVSDVTANVGGVPDVSITDSVFPPTANATLTVPTNDIGATSVGFNTTSLSGMEGGQVTLCATLQDLPNAGLGSTITLQLQSTSVKSAIENEDFIIPAFSFSSSPSDTTSCINITILDDANVEGPHSFTVQILSTTPSIMVRSDDSTVTIYIIDNDVIEVDLMVNDSTADFEVLEESPNAEVCVVVDSLPENGTLQCDVQVLVTTFLGTASQQDFTETQRNLTLPAGSVATNRVCFNLGSCVVVNDEVVEMTETFTLSLTSSSTSVSIGNASIQGSIIDADVAMISLNGSVPATPEGQTVSICVVIGLAAPLETNVTVMLSSDSSEITITDGSVTFVPTTTSGSILCFSVLAIEDNTLEGDETVSLMLSADDDVATISNSEVQLTIQDVLQAGDITAAFNFTMLEGAEGTTVMVCAEITSLLILNTSVTFQVGVSEPSDVGGVDPIVFTEANSTVCDAVMLLVDDNVEGPETATLTLFNPTPTIPDFNLVTATLNIQDINQAQLIFEPLSFQEMEGASFNVCLRLGGEGWFDLERQVEAILGSDGVGSGDITIAGRILFTQGLMVNVIRCRMVSVIQDNLLEASENFNIFVSDVTANVGGVPDVSITDNVLLPTANATLTVPSSDTGSATVGFNSTLLTETEGGWGVVQLCAVLENLPSDGLGSQLTLQITRINIKSAIEDEDYETIPELSFSPSSSLMLVSCIDITIIDDDDVEGPHAFELSISSTTPSITVRNDDSTVRVDITDNDVVQVSLMVDGSTGSFEVPEESPSAEVCVVVDSLPENGTLQCDVQVLVTTVLGTASVRDFSETQRTLIIPAGSNVTNRTCFNLASVVINDEVVEMTETFTLSLSSSSTNVSFGSATVQGSITDVDDTKVGFEQALYTQMEGETVMLCVTVDRILERSLLVNIQSAALKQEDSELGQSVDVSIGPDASPSNPVSMTIFCSNFSVMDDIYKEGEEFLRLNLTTLDSQVCLGRDLALVQIPANDRVNISVVNGTLFEVNENVGSLRICLEADHALETTITVTLSTTSVTAIENEDFLPVNKTLIFTRGASLVQCAYIPILNDECLEDNEETFNISLSTTFDCVYLPEDEIEVTIRDDDNVLIGFRDQMVYVYEGATYIACIDICEGVIKRNVDIMVEFENGTAEYPMDFAFNGSRNFTFIPGNTMYCFPVQTVDDMVLEDKENFSLVLSSPDPDVDLKTRMVTVKIRDNDAVTLSLSQSVYMVNETDGFVQVCVDLTGEIQRSVTAEVSTLPSTATGGQDFNSTTMTITFESAGQECVSIPITADMILENKERFLVVLRSQDSGVNLGLSSAMVRIIDANTVVVGFSQTTYTVIEDTEAGGSIAQVCVALNGEVDRTIRVFVSTSDGTAIAGVDYNEVLASLMTIEVTFGGSRKRREVDESMTRCVNISIIADNIVENDETFTVTLSTEDPDVVLNPQNAIVIIETNDFANVSLECDSVVVDESVQSLEVCTTFISGELGINITVNLSTICGSACNMDFSQLEDTPLVFPIGTPIGDMQCVTVNISDDDLVEDDETFTLSLTSSDAVFLFPNSSKEVTIVNNDFANVSLACDFLAVSESDDEAQVCAVLTAGDLAITVAVNLSTVCGSACYPMDFQQLTDVPLTFLPGSPIGSLSCANVTIIDDVFVENDESFSVSITSAPPVFIFPNSSKEIAIMNNDFANVSLECDSLAVLESTTPVEVCAVLTVGELAIDITVSLSTICGEACYPMDFGRLSDVPLVFPVNTSIGTRRCVNITINDDLYVENDELFSLAITSSDPVFLFPNSSKEILIQNNDFANVSLVCDTLEVAETAGPIQVCAVLNAGLLAIDITVNLSTICGQACYPMDFVRLDDVPLVFPPNTSIGTMRCANLTINDDTLVENDEIFSVSLTSSDPVFIVPFSSKEILIMNNDFANISLSCDTLEVSEAVGSISVCAVLVTGDLAINVTVILNTNTLPNGAGPNDFQMIENSPLVFPVNTSIGTQKCVSILISDDNITENDEIFTAELTTMESFVNLFPNRSKDISIMNNDVIEIMWQLLMYTFPEGSTSSASAVIVTGSLERQVVARVQTILDTAASSDFSPSSIDLTFSSGDMVGSLAPATFEITNDTIVEAAETFNISLSVLPGEPISVIQSGSVAVVEIPEDPADTVLIALTPVNAAVPEGDVASVHVVIVEGTLERNVVLRLQTQNGTATGGSDFTPLDVTLTLTLTVTRIYFNISTLQDDLLELTQSFTVQLSTMDSAVRFSTNSAMITIEDDETGLVTVESDTEVCESPGAFLMACFNLTSNFTIEDGTAVDIAIQDIDTSGSSDYTGVPSTLMFGPDFRQCFNLTIVDDNITEPCERFMYDIDNVGGLLSLQTVTVTINDDEPLDLCYNNDSPRVNEDANSMSISIDFVGCVGNALCVAPTRRTTADCTPPTGSSVGTASLSPAFPRRNSFRTILVTAAPRCGQQSIVNAPRSVIRVSRTRCSAIAINKGIQRFANGTVIAEWRGVAESQSQAAQFTCSTQSGRLSPTTCSSPFDVTSAPNTFQVGTPETLIVRPAINTVTGCSRGIGLRLGFTP